MREQDGHTALEYATDTGIRQQFEALEKAKPVADWLEQPTLDLGSYFRKFHYELGVKARADLPGLTTAQLSSIGMQAAEVTSFTAAVQALTAPTEPPQSTEPVVSAAQPGASGAKRKRPSAPSGSCTGWSEAEVQQWLESRGLDVHYAESFVLLEGSDLKGLTTEVLGTLRPPIGEFVAKKLLKAIAELK